MPKGHTVSQLILDTAEWVKLPESTRKALIGLRERVQNSVDTGFGRFAAMLFGADSNGKFETADGAKTPTDHAVKISKFFTWLATKNKSDYNTAMDNKTINAYEAAICKAWGLKVKTTV